MTFAFAPFAFANSPLAETASPTVALAVTAFAGGKGAA
jgi:hypothetical protein